MNIWSPWSGCRAAADRRGAPCAARGTRRATGSNPPAAQPSRGAGHLGRPRAAPVTALAARLVQLNVGLFLYGFTMAMMVESTLGPRPVGRLPRRPHPARAVSPSARSSSSTGRVVLLLWIPLRQMPGVGTVLNVIVIGLAADFGIAVIAQPDEHVAAGAAAGRGSGRQRLRRCALHRRRAGLRARATGCGSAWSGARAAVSGSGAPRSRSRCWPSASRSAAPSASAPCSTPLTIGPIVQLFLPPAPVAEERRISEPT